MSDSRIELNHRAGGDARLEGSSGAASCSDCAGKSRSSTPNATASGGPRQRGLEKFWPTGASAPPTAPWVARVVTREQVAAAAGTDSASDIALRGTVVKRSDDRVGAGATSPILALACPEDQIECTFGGNLTEMASDWADAGGLLRDIVEILYYLIGEATGCDLCETGLRESCTYLGTELRQGFGEYGNQPWDYVIYCCCTISKGIPPFIPIPGGPKTPDPGLVLSDR